MSTFRPIYNSGGMSTTNQRPLSLRERFRLYGTTEPINQTPRQPIQTIPAYQSGEIGSAIRQYSQQLSGILGGVTDFGYQAQPINWRDITSREVSARAAVDESLGYNEANLGRYTAMAQELTRADLQTRTAMLDQFVPDWRQKRDAASAINESLMRGEIPKDVADQLKRSAAYTSVMGGGGAGTQRALTARDLGTTSLQLQQQGMQGAQSWTTLMAGLMPEQTTAAGVMATQGMTPQMALETSLQNAANQLQADITNVQGRMEAGYRTQDIGLRAETARVAAQQGLADLAARGAATALEARTTNIANQYSAAMNASAIAFANLNRPYQAWRESLGLTTGQQQRTGFGL